MYDRYLVCIYFNVYVFYGSLYIDRKRVASPQPRSAPFIDIEDALEILPLIEQVDEMSEFRV